MLKLYKPTCNRFTSQ